MAKSLSVFTGVGLLFSLAMHGCGGGGGNGQVASLSDIEFVLNDTYLLGETVAVKIQNVGKISYVFNPVQEACNLSYFDASGRRFFIPPGSHCDIPAAAEIAPGEVKTLFRWDLDECIGGVSGGIPIPPPPIACGESRPLPAGTYTIRGEFHPSGLPGRGAGGPTAVAEKGIRIVASPLPFSTIDRGSFSGIQDARQVVVRDQARWEALWTEHTANKLPKPPVPPVDFSREMVVGNFAGTSQAGDAIGFISILSIAPAPSGRDIRVHVQAVAFDGRCPGPRLIILRPFHVVKLARSDAEVSFESSLLIVERESVGCP